MFAQSHNAQLGDVHLSSALLLHSLTMNGGLLNAVESLSAPEVDAAAHGFTWLGLDGAAKAIGYVRDEIAGGALDAADSGEALEFRADELYNAIVQDDSTLEEAFRVMLARFPELFEPL